MNDKYVFKSAIYYHGEINFIISLGVFKEAAEEKGFR